MRVTRRWWHVTVVLLAALCLGLGSALIFNLNRGNNGYPSGVTFGGLPEVGALFSSNTIPVHTCTASVVDSSAGNVVVTAAHCLSGSAQSYVFEPMFHDGTAPFGKWRVTGAYVDPRWRSTRDPRFDYAFLTIAPRVLNGQLTNIQSVVGGNPLDLKARFGIPVLIIGYPVGIMGRPIMCAAVTYDHLGYPAVDCNGYVDGTSGSPWLIVYGPSTTTSAIYGVIGGLQQGGATPSISYSSLFDNSTAAVYNCARGLTPAGRCVDMRMP